MADTALTIITDALSDISVLAEEETPTASQAAGALRKLNNMIDAWNIESLSVYGSVPLILPFISSQGSYTIGPGGNLDTPRPTNIFAAYVRNVSLPLAQQQDIPLYIFNPAEWAAVQFKGQIGNYPFNGVFFDMQFPLITAYVNPIPIDGSYSMIIWEKGIISNFSLTDPILLAPGYKRALTSNLSKELCASYELPVPDSVETIATNSKAELMVVNLEINEMQIDPLLAGYRTFNIQTRQYQ